MSMQANHRRRRSDCSAFTLIELLVVIGIIAVLMAILFPAFKAARLSAIKVQCGSNIRQIGAAIIGYAGINKGKFPIKDLSRDPNPWPALYVWGKWTLVEPLKDYGAPMSILSCPAQQLIFNPPEPFWHDPDNGYMVHYAYIAGRGDDAETGFMGMVWLENPRSGAGTMLKNGKGVIVADLNLMFNSPDNGFNNGATYTGPYIKWLYTNHGIENKLDLNLVEARKFVRGSNRCFADGHVEWVLPDMMGSNDGPMTGDPSSGRFDDGAGGGATGTRPYYW
jgi:prepilin-type N-terminal cleavage/methylation domain-containing protein/prepilin-type processing-associated H-X9-DG protein